MGGCCKILWVADGSNFFIFKEMPIRIQSAGWWVGMGPWHYQLLARLALCRGLCALPCAKNSVGSGRLIFVFVGMMNVSRKFVRVTYNVLRLCEEADFGAQNCQHTTKVDARQNVQLTTEPAFLQNRCYSQWFLSSVLANHCRCCVSPSLSLSCWSVRLRIFYFQKGRRFF